MSTEATQHNWLVLGLVWRILDDFITYLVPVQGWLEGWAQLELMTGEPTLSLSSRGSQGTWTSYMVGVLRASRVSQEAWAGASRPSMSFLPHSISSDSREEDYTPSSSQREEWPICCDRDNQAHVCANIELCTEYYGSRGVTGMSHEGLMRNSHVS